MWTLIGAQNYVYIAVFGGLLLFWSCFRAWDEQREAAEKASPEELRRQIESLQHDLQDMRDHALRWRIIKSEQRERFKNAIKGRQVYITGGIVCRAGDTEAVSFTQQLIGLFRETGSELGYGFSNNIRFVQKGLSVLANDVNSISDHCRTLMEGLDAARVTYKLIQNPNVNVQTARASGGANLDLLILAIGENDEQAH